MDNEMFRYLFRMLNQREFKGFSLSNFVFYLIDGLHNLGIGSVVLWGLAFYFLGKSFKT